MVSPGRIWQNISKLSSIMGRQAERETLQIMDQLIREMGNALQCVQLGLYAYPENNPQWGLVLPGNGRPLIGFQGTDHFLSRIVLSGEVIICSPSEEERNSTDSPVPGMFQELAHGLGWQVPEEDGEWILLHHTRGGSTGGILGYWQNSYGHRDGVAAVFGVILDTVLGYIQEFWKDLGLILSAEDAELVSSQLGQDYIILSRDLTHPLSYTSGILKTHPQITDPSPWSWVGWIHPDDRQDFIKTCSESAGTDISLNLQVRTQESGWVQIRTLPRRDSQGNIHTYLGIVEDITAEKARETELVEARDMEILLSARIQKALLSGFEDITYGNLTLAGMTLPSKEVDGDFYDAIPGQKGTLDLMIGDVMGKGVAASLLGAATRSQVYRVILGLIQTDQEGGSGTTLLPENVSSMLPGITRIIDSLNDRISPDLIAINQFITLNYARFYQDPHHLDFVDCGHPPVIYWDSRKATCWQIKGSNMPIGFSGSQEYRHHSLPLNPGDLLVFYSDGLTEADDEADVPFDTRGIQEYLHSRMDVVTHQPPTPRELIHGLSNQALLHSGGRFTDDVTVICIQLDQKCRGRDQTILQWDRTLPALADIRQGIASVFLAAHPDEEEPIQELVLAAHEGLTNIADHNETVSPDSQEVPLILAWDDYNLWICIDYHGDSYDWQDVPENPLEHYHERGYGRFIIQELASSFAVLESGTTQKRLVLTKQLTQVNRRYPTGKELHE
ncbi:ATP-binding SpoIIE family protein phosphatase [Spirochaeta lutea]|uniref:PAC domain-containing protein n=1 Tax=Spirochaeta lutea TaxID=1480694 RepID=A0A098QVX1_9SPIO|nr:SpoIIE family protein phosphatase [Spirochaeta lutea]KGE72015.1 hypothetical protein DC28_07825 [Spirochaeta lutea]